MSYIIWGLVLCKQQDYISRAFCHTIEVLVLQYLDIKGPYVCMFSSRHIFKCPYRSTHTLVLQWSFCRPIAWNCCINVISMPFGGNLLQTQLNEWVHRLVLLDAIKQFASEQHWLVVLSSESAGCRCYTAIKGHMELFSCLPVLKYCSRLSVTARGRKWSRLKLGVK